MADTTITVDADTRAAITSLNALKTTIVGIVSGDIIRGFATFADSLTNITNRLNTLNSSAEDAKNAFSGIAAIALNTGASLTDVSTLFTKLQVATRDLGLSQRDVATITDVLTKQLAIQGASSTEASSAMYQFSQAMALGTFQGNDLHSLMVSMPDTMQKFANHLGITAGELRKFGSQGLITAQQMVDFLKSIEGATDEKFSSRVVTIGQAFEILQTQVKLSYDELDKTFHISENLSTTILNLSGSLSSGATSVRHFWEEWGGVIKVIAYIASFTVAVGWIYKGIVAFGAAASGVLITVVEFGAGLTRIFGTISGIFAAFSAEAATVAAGIADIFGTGTAAQIVAWTNVVITGLAPIGRFVAGVTALVATTIGFKSATDSSTKSTEQAADALGDYRDKWDRVKEGMSAVATQSRVNEEEQKKLAAATALARLAAKNQTDDLKANLQYTREKLKFDADEVMSKGQLTLKDKDQIEVDTALFELTHQRSDAIRKLQQEQAKLNLEYDKIPKGLRDSESAQELKAKIGVIGEQINTEKQLYDQQGKALPELIKNKQYAALQEKIANDLLVKDLDLINAKYDERIKVEKALKDITEGITLKKTEVQFETTQIGQGPLARQMAQIQEDARKNAQAAAKAFIDSFDNYDGSIEQYNRLRAGLDEIAQGWKDISDAQIENLKNSRSWSAGWDEAFATYKENAFNAADEARTYFSDFTKGFEDMFVSLVTTGKWSFTDFANSIIADFARIQAKKLLVSMMSGGSGNIFSSIASVFGFAAGGQTDGKSPIMVGERGPEMFLPGGAGTIIPNNQLGQGYQPSITNVNYNIQAVDASSFRSLVARDPQFIYAVTEQGRRSQPSQRLA